MTKIKTTPLRVPPGADPILQDFARSVAACFADLAKDLNSVKQPGDVDLAMSGRRITNLSDPAAARDAVNREYLDKRLAEVQLQGGAAGNALGTTTLVTTLAIQISY